MATTTATTRAHTTATIATKTPDQAHHDRLASDQISRPATNTAAAAFACVDYSQLGNGADVHAAQVGVGGGLAEEQGHVVLLQRLLQALEV